MNIAVCGAQEGSGRTTLAGLLALCLADAGKKVIALDRSPKGTLKNWLNSVGGRNNPNFGGNNVSIFNLQESAPPGDESPFRIHDFPVLPSGAAKIMDETGETFNKIVIPCRPHFLDVRSTRGFLKTLTGCKVQTLIIMNALNNDDARSSPKYINYMLAGVETPRTKTGLFIRACYSQAVSFGWKALDESAKREVRSIVLEIMT